MRYPPIFHLRCTHCHASYVAVVWDLQCLCFFCDHVSWQVVEVWLRSRTPWVDAPGYGGTRLFPVSTPAGFLERLPHSMARAREDFVPGTCFAAPGLSRTMTRLHTPWCPTHTDAFAPCDEECREEVTYARVAAAPN